MYNKENPSYHMNYLMIRKLGDMGSAIQILHEVLRLDIFDDLSKHGKMWQNENDEIWEGLNKIRSGLIDVEEKVSKAIEILDVEVPE